MVQVAVRLWLSAGQTLPVATPDETGYLFAARVLTGGPGADVSFGTVYRSGYSLLLMPAFWITHDPELGYRIALVINALVSALMLPLAFLLLRRLSLTRRSSYALAHATALLPAVVFYAEFVLTDAVLPVVVLGWLLLAHNWLTAPASTSPARVACYGAGAGLLAAYAYISHTRGVVLMAVTAGLIVVAAARRWRTWRTAAVPLLVMGVVAALGTLVNHHLLPLLYPNGDNDLSGNLLERVTSVHGWGWFLALGTGQVWYQIVATAGLAGIGLVVVAVVAGRRDADPRVRLLAVALILIVVGIAFATSAALPDEYRVGNYAYGRYLACVTPILFAVGAATLLRGSRRTVLRTSAAAAVLTLATTGVIGLYAGDRLSRYTYNSFDFPEISVLTLDWSAFRLWTATLAGLGLLGLLVVVVGLPRRRGSLMAGLLIAANVLIVTTVTMQIARPLARQTQAWTELGDSVDRSEQPTVAVDWNVPWKLRMPQLYALGWLESLTFDSSWQQPPTRADVVILNWTSGLPAEDTWRKAPADFYVAASRWTPEGGWVVWRRA